MNQKYFVIKAKEEKLSRDEIFNIEQDKIRKFNESANLKKELNKKRLANDDVQLKHTFNRIIIKIDLDGKDTHTFEDGTQIYRGRRYNNLNLRETDPVNAFVIDAEDIPKGAEIIIHPNAICDANKVFGYESISAEQENSVRYYSIETISAFLWRMGTDEWNPVKGFATALRVFEPYKGIIEGVLPKKLKDILYITSGELKGKACVMLKAADYECIFIESNGRERHIIRCRHYEESYHDREEVCCIHHTFTEQIESGELLIGLSESDCKKINQ